MRIKFKNIAISSVSVVSAAVVGSLATVQNVRTWYPSLVKSAINPPDIVFGPVWTFLYILMIVAFYLVLSVPESKKRRLAIRVFVYQLALNAMWSVAFFGLKSIFTGLLIIIALWFTIIATIFRFSQVEKKAAWLLAPYLAWVTLAMYLNYAVFVLN